MLALEADDRLDIGALTLFYHGYLLLQSRSQGTH